MRGKREKARIGGELRAVAGPKRRGKTGTAYGARDAYLRGGNFRGGEDLGSVQKRKAAIRKKKGSQLDTSRKMGGKEERDPRMGGDECVALRGVLYLITKKALKNPQKKNRESKEENLPVPPKLESRPLNKKETPRFHFSGKERDHVYGGRKIYDLEGRTGRRRSAKSGLTGILSG